jgi:hypothetical protein
MVIIRKIRRRKHSTRFPTFSLFLICAFLRLRPVQGFAARSIHDISKPKPTILGSIFASVHGLKQSTICGCSRYSTVRLYSEIDRDTSDGSTSTAFDATATSQRQHQPLAQVDVVYGRRTDLVYDPTLDRYVSMVQSNTKNNDPIPINRFLRFLGVAFVPHGVTNNYYTFMQWRILQRFVNANLHVFGTQSLLLSLTSGRGLVQSAALNWVLKDALGKIVRMLWASKMGRRFDSDAKRWRFRSSLVYALGNALEIVTFLVPHLFLICATLANCCKQVSMLTSSSTRTAIYTSFRDGSRDNIGDITAKGEAQIAVVDLLGIASGISLSRSIGTSVKSVICVYFILQILEIACMKQMLQAVQYRVFNYERLIRVISRFCRFVQLQGTENVISSRLPDPLLNGFCKSSTTTENIDKTTSNLLRNSTLTDTDKDSESVMGIPTPQSLAQTERIFLPPRHLFRREVVFGSLGRTQLSPRELDELQTIFQGERFLLIVGQNVKHPRRQSRMDESTRLQANCHIVLHENATNADIVKSTLSLILLRRNLASSGLDPQTVRSSDCMDLIKAAASDGDKLYMTMVRQMYRQGWEPPARSMFGRTQLRADWPLTARATNLKANLNTTKQS